MKRLLLIAALCIAAQGFAQKKAPTSYDLVVGTYTKGTSKGINVYRFYVETGKLAYLSQSDNTSNPSYVAVSKDNRFVYAVNEDGKDGGVSAFSFEPNVGTMKLLNKQSSKGADPCYISVDGDRKNVIVANYSSGNVTVLPINKDGSLGAASQVIQDAGKGPDKERQEGPHAHMAYFTPDEKYLLFTDLGTDKINIARYHASAAKPLTLENSISVKPGNGPRHMVFSPDHKYLYLLQEMGSAINVYAYSGGKLKELQNIEMKLPNFKGTNGAAAIKITPDGHFLYATDRLDASSILVYSISPETGKLTFMERHNTAKNPRDFAIDPTGKWLLIASQDDDNIQVFRINPGTGSLSSTGISVKIGNPVCLKFTAAE
jgi:6-phosphogluconolactonase